MATAKTIAPDMTLLAIVAGPADVFVPYRSLLTRDYQNRVKSLRYC